ncbi:type II toxin-antitoxin system VapC family toxin [Pigmentiphaga soli]|uniref:Ribonuclease VapC n=1 Tax=Pigmentiphaga soli TaxID=1007095 RepID=A0ABP8H193_9BURK
MLILDSNTISYYFRGDPDVVPRMQAEPPSAFAVPAIVAYELRYGLLRLPPTAGKPRLQALDKLLGLLPILPFDAACAAQAAAIRAALERQGRPIGPHDLLIAAIALQHKAPLVTRNVREFGQVPGLQVVNWHKA